MSVEEEEESGAGPVSVRGRRWEARLQAPFVSSWPLVTWPEQSPIHLCLGQAKSTQADTAFLSGHFTEMEGLPAGLKAGYGQRPGRAGVTWPWSPQGAKCQPQVALLSGGDS